MFEESGLLKGSVECLTVILCESKHVAIKSDIRVHTFLLNRVVLE
jgi:hypothetical protein